MHKREATEYHVAHITKCDEALKALVFVRHLLCAPANHLTPFHRRTYLSSAMSPAFSIDTHSKLQLDPR